MLIFYFKDAQRAQGCDPSEVCSCMACQAQISEYSAVCIEYPAFIQSSATAEEDGREGEAHQSAYDLYWLFIISVLFRALMLTRGLRELQYPYSTGQENM